MMEVRPDLAKVLVVDDMPLNRKLQKTYLTEVGYQVVLAEDGIEALKRIREESPDLILLDVMMPKMDGYEVCEKLKSNPVTKDIPVIFLTALSEVQNEARGDRKSVV